MWPPAFGTNRELATDMTVLGMKIPAGTVIWVRRYFNLVIYSLIENGRLFSSIK